MQLLEGEEVAAADWDEDASAWELYLSSSGGSLRSSHVWLATGEPRGLQLGPRVLKTTWPQVQEPASKAGP